MKKLIMLLVFTLLLGGCVDSKKKKREVRKEKREMIKELKQDSTLTDSIKAIKIDSLKIKKSKIT